MTGASNAGPAAIMPDTNNRLIAHGGGARDRRDDIKLVLVGNWIERCAAAPSPQAMCHNAKN